MKLTLKLTALVAVGVAAVFAFYGYGRIDAAREALERDMRADQLAVARALEPVLARAWRLEGEASAQYLLAYTERTLDDTAERPGLELRWVSLAAGTPPARRPLAGAAQLAPVLRGEETTFMRVAAPGGPRVVSYVPVAPGIDATTAGAIEVSEPRAPMTAYVDSVRSSVLAAMAALLAVCVLIPALLGVWLVGRPMQRMADAAARIGSGDLSVRVGMRRRDEIGHVARALDAMAEQLAEALQSLQQPRSGRYPAVTPEPPLHEALPVDERRG